MVRQATDSVGMRGTGILSGGTLAGAELTADHLRPCGASPSWACSVAHHAATDSSTLSASCTPRAGVLSTTSWSSSRTTTTKAPSGRPAAGWLSSRSAPCRPDVTSRYAPRPGRWLPLSAGYPEPVQEQSVSQRALTKCHSRGASHRPLSPGSNAPTTGAGAKTGSRDSPPSSTNDHVPILLRGGDQGPTGGEPPAAIPCQWAKRTPAASK